MKIRMMTGIKIRTAAGMLEAEIGLSGWELLFYQHECRVQAAGPVLKGTGP